MDAKHTPGPWRAGMSSVLARNPETKAWATIGGYRKGIAFPAEVGQANLRLAAAAPDLLEALQSLIDMNVGYMRGKKVSDAVDAAKAVIAKATGAA